MALEDNNRTYQEVIAAGIQISRPDAEISSIELDALEEEVRNFKPHVVISSLPATADFEDVPAWIELSPDLSRPTMVFIEGRHLEQSNHMRLEQLLNVLYEVEQLILSD